jgi:hypothetical protein
VALATAASATTPTTVSVNSGPNDQSGSQTATDATGISASESAGEAVTPLEGTAEATTTSDGVGGHQDAAGIDTQFTGQQ